ncbi:beta-eliminating lyase-related protein [Aliiglaciecola sp. LCG003]|uniref:threonine aldolase family protein n=1 Tax=Aliiglaciecola sp. LCG003 TaxID=3053655 RepID=UPI002573F9A3|nr:beta-eliminating lyase-related protein [Aliiglaciecola sp. LCG003]WJG09913.1 beta-eliminating lyase-related protein [Aliiglaciecola sp. LCG003]
MTLISDLLKTRFDELHAHAKAAIHRHQQLDMADELKLLSQSITSNDSRDSYGRGGIISDFEQQLSQLFSTQSCLFLPTGTLAQCAALKCYSQLTGRSYVGLHPTSHLLLHEHRAIEQLWGLNVAEMGTYNQVLTIDDFGKLDPATTAAIIIETPMREIGGQLPSWSDLTTIKAWCKEHGIKLHLDGARIWQTTEFYQRPLAEIASLFDSIYVSFYKDLGGISGAALLGSDKLIDQARVWARRAGGNPITLYPEVIAARAGLNKYLSAMPQFVDYTRQLCDALRCAPLSIVPANPQVAMFHLHFDMSAQDLAARIVSYAQHTGIIVLPLPRSGSKQTCVCEISIGDRAVVHQPNYWAEHIQACLAQ